MEISVTIDGVTPILLNKFTDAAAENATNGTRGSSAAAERGTPREIAESKLYRGLSGAVAIPQPNLLRCIVEGGLFHKIGKQKITTQRSSMLYACLDIQGADIVLIHREPWRVDTRPIRIPSTGGRILAHRPLFDDWRLNFVFDLDTSILGPKLLRMIVDDAGKRIGLGDFRPHCKGPFGKFVVTSWVEEEGELLRKAA